MKTTYRILIVDDEDNVRRMLATAFSLQGHETHCASDGKAALSLFSETQPDVVLMDIRMPEMDGIDALKKAVKDGLAEDEQKNAEAKLQKIHDKYIKQIEDMLADKDKEIMTV